MRLPRRLASIRNALGRGVFPHELSLFLELPWRAVLLSPRTLAERLRLTARDRVLEVGAGSGYYSVEVARRVPEGRLELLDLQPEMLAKARRKVEAAGLRNVGFTATSADRLPFGDGAFDVVYLVAVLGEIARRDAFLREAHRVLRPGGTLSVSEHVPDPDRISADEVARLASVAGFAFRERLGRSWSYTASFTRP